MAKLSAHGNEVARLVTQAEVENCRYHYHYSFRSDGHILRRVVGLDVHPDESDPARRRHDFGWKLWVQIPRPKNDTVRRITAIAHRMAAGAEAKGILLDINAKPY